MSRAGTSKGDLLRLGFLDPERVPGRAGRAGRAGAEPLLAMLWRAAADPDQALAGAGPARRGRPTTATALLRELADDEGTAMRLLSCSARARRSADHLRAAPRALARADRPDARLHPPGGVRRARGPARGRSAPTPRTRPRRRRCRDARGRGRAAGGVPPACCSGSRPATWPTTSASTTWPPSCPTWPPAPSRRRWRRPAAGRRGRAGRPARGHRDGQVRRPRAQLRLRRRRDLRLRAGRGRRRGGGRRAPPPSSPSHLMQVCSDHTARGHDLAGRRRPAPRGQGRPAGAHPGQPPRLLRALGQDLGVPGAAQGPPGRRRPRRSASEYVDAGRADGLAAPPSATGFVERRAGDAPPGGRAHPGPRGRAAAQARLGRAARRRVRRPAAPARARPRRRAAPRRRPP